MRSHVSTAPLCRYTEATSRRGSARGARRPVVDRWPKTCWGVPGWVHPFLGRLDREESLLKTRSYRMSYLDIAMAGGVLLLLVLIILRKKTR